MNKPSSGSISQSIKIAFSRVPYNQSSGALYVVTNPKGPKVQVSLESVSGLAILYVTSCYLVRPCLSVCLFVCLCVRLTTASAQCLRRLWALFHFYLLSNKFVVFRLCLLVATCSRRIMLSHCYVNDATVVCFLPC